MAIAQRSLPGVECSVEALVLGLEHAILLFQPMAVSINSDQGDKRQHPTRHQNPVHEVHVHLLDSKTLSPRGAGINISLPRLTMPHHCA